MGQRRRGRPGLLDVVARRRADPPPLGAGFAETAEAVAKVGFTMYLGVAAQVARWSEDGRAFSLVLDDTPLTEMV